MTIDIEKLLKDMEAGTHGPNHSYLAGEYLAIREAADALADAVENIDPDGAGVYEAADRAAAYRKATG